MSRVVVVGGGVIGVACAHYLERSGRSVTLIDRGAIGSGCSHGNCGFISPSHVLPLAGPGVLGPTLLALLQKNSPLRIRPRLDLSLWRWLWDFARQCTRGRMLASAAAIQALLDASRRLYGELFQTEPLQAEWEERGVLFVFRTQKAMDHYAETERLLREHFHRPADRYDGDAVRQLEPALKPGLAGGWHYPWDAHLRPDRLLASWRDLLAGRGVDLREGCPFEGFVTEGGRVSGVRTGTGVLPADHVVVATGAWTPLLKKDLGCRLPIQPGKGYSITMGRPAVCPAIPLIFEEHRVAVTPLKSTYRIGSTMEFAGYDATLDRSRIELLIRSASEYLVEPTAEPVIEEWWGWRPMVHDSRPIIGPSPRHPNVLIAAGHNMLGMSMAPATGKLVAQLVSGEAPHVDPAPYSPLRF